MTCDNELRARLAYASRKGVGKVRKEAEQLRDSACRTQDSIIDFVGSHL